MTKQGSACEMTSSISRDGGAFEWASKNLATVFCQPRRLVDREIWRMIYDVLCFNVCSRRVLLHPLVPGEQEMSIGEYLKKEGYSSWFRNMINSGLFFRNDLRRY